MENLSEDLRVFLEKFEANSNVGSPEEIATQFANVFMAADPSGARAVPCSVLLMAIPQRRKLLERGKQRYYARIGEGDEVG